MGNPRKPQALRDIQGTAKDHPGRQNQNQPIPTRGIGPSPDHLPDAVKEIWDEIVGIMYAGVLGEADRISLEAMCRLVHQMRTDFDSMTAAQLTRLNGFLSQFGMTPADRTKISVPKQGKKNPFEGF